MKKFFATILAFVYLSASMGATIHFHYCMSKFVSWSLSDRESKTCANCGMQKNTQNPNSLSAKSNCCHDEVKQVKTDKDQKIPQTDLQFSKIFAEAFSVHNPALSDNLFSSLAVAFPNSNAPPIESKNRIFILNRNFRI
jgi:hypothetical protein